MRKWVGPVALLSLVGAAAFLFFWSFEVPVLPVGVALGVALGAPAGFLVGRLLWRAESAPPVRVRWSRKRLAAVVGLEAAVLALIYFEPVLLSYAAAARLAVSAFGVALFAGAASSVLTISFLDWRARSAAG